MRTSFRAAATALVLTVVASLAQAQGTSPSVKIGYVNTQALMAAAPGRDAASALYEKDAQAFAAQRKRWQDSLSKSITDYQKVEPTLSATVKATRQEKIQSMQTELEAEDLKGQQKLQQRQNELLAPLMELVKTAIDDIRSEGGYAMIFSGDDNSPIVSADKNLDLTEKVVARLKTMAAKTVAPAAPSAMAPAAVKKPPTQ
jgi:outer membrane protein